MLRPFVLKSAVITAAGTAAFFFSPVAAQAVTAIPATQDIITYFTGLTYPDTSVGLSDCESEGEELIYISDGEDISYGCNLGTPDAGVYNLWITYWNPKVCRTC
jgi:hypothetical protein